MRTNSTMMRVFSSLLLVWSTLPAYPALGAVDQAAVSTLLSAAEPAETMGGLESRITNLPLMQVGVPPLPPGNVVNVEVTSQLSGVGNPTVTATGNGVSLPVTLVGSVTAASPSTGIVALYQVDVNAACNTGTTIILTVNASILSGAFTSQVSRWVVDC